VRRPGVRRPAVRRAGVREVARLSWEHPARLPRPCRHSSRASATRRSASICTTRAAASCRASSTTSKACPRAPTGKQRMEARLRVRMQDAWYQGWVRPYGRIRRLRTTRCCPGVRAAHRALPSSALAPAPTAWARPMMTRVLIARARRGSLACRSGLDQRHSVDRSASQRAQPTTAVADRRAIRRVVPVRDHDWGRTARVTFLPGPRSVARRVSRNRPLER
jgi:hypothetical protein